VTSQIKILQTKNRQDARRRTTADECATNAANAGNAELREAKNAKRVFLGFEKFRQQEEMKNNIVHTFLDKSAIERRKFFVGGYDLSKRK
jgi:hypothetical protein